MKIPRRKPEPPPSEPTIWEKLTDFISDSGNWEKFEPGQHSHGIDIYDPDHSHGITAEPSSSSNPPHPGTGTALG